MGAAYSKKIFFISQKIPPGSKIKPGPISLEPESTGAIMYKIKGSEKIL